MDLERRIRKLSSWREIKIGTKVTIPKERPAPSNPFDMNEARTSSREEISLLSPAKVRKRQFTGIIMASDFATGFHKFKISKFTLFLIFLFLVLDFILLYILIRSFR